MVVVLVPPSAAAMVPWWGHPAHTDGTTDFGHCTCFRIHNTCTLSIRFRRTAPTRLSMGQVQPLGVMLGMALVLVLALALAPDWALDPAMGLRQEVW